MKHALSRSVVPFLAATMSLSAWAGATVKFTDPDHYADMPFTQWDRADVLKQLEEHFAKLAQALPAGQDLKVEVTDVDLAGSIDHARHAGRDLRILRGMADWPRINFKYSIESGGKALKSGSATVSDMNYLRNQNRYPSNEPLRYEKRMLDQWFAKEIAAGAKS